MAERKGREEEAGEIFGLCGETNVRTTTKQEHASSAEKNEECDFLINEAAQKDRCLPGKKNEEDEEEAEKDEDESENSRFRKAMQRFESSQSSSRAAFDEYRKIMQEKLAKAVQKYREVSKMRNKLDKELKQTRNKLQDWRSEKKRKCDQAPEASRKRKHSYSTSEGKKCFLCKKACTPSGDHTICSLHCGHFFGKSCITELFENNKDGNRSSKCPKCSRKALLKDIRDHDITDMHDAEDDYEQVEGNVSKGAS